MEPIDKILPVICEETGIDLVSGSWESMNGLSNENFKISLPDAAYVLRVPPPGSSAYIDRVIEAHNTQRAAEWGLCEQPLYVDLKTGVRLMPFIDATPILTISEPAHNRCLVLIATALRRLHTSGVRFRGQREIKHEIVRYVAMTGPDCALATRLRSILEAMGQNETDDGIQTDLAPCHIDLTPGNLLYSRGSKRLHIIDWEFSGMANPIWDLATVALEFQLTDEQETRLMEAYFGYEAPGDRTHLRQYKGLIDLLACAWALTRAKQAPDEDEWLTYSEKRLESGASRLT